MAKLIAEGNIWNLSDLKNYEGMFKEGDTGSIVLGLRSPIPQSAIDALESGLKRAGVTLNGHITQKSGAAATLRIPFKKAIPPLAIIVAVIAGLVIIWVLITSWQLMQDVGLNPAKIMPFLILGVIGVAAYFFLKARPGIKIGG